MTDEARLRDVWNSRYADFSLSESGWMGAGEGLNDRLYACKRQALRASLAAAGVARNRPWSVLDAGCGQGHFARFYRSEYRACSYVGVDISDRAVGHLRRTIPDAEFHVADLSNWSDPAGRAFDVVQSIDVLHLMLDDRTVVRALGNLARCVAPDGVLLITAAMPAETVRVSDYLCYRSRAFWTDAIASQGLRLTAERPMYFWLPAGGPRNKYLRYALTQLGPSTLYALDRLAFAAGLPPPASAGMDSQMRLLTLRRA